MDTGFCAWLFAISIATSTLGGALGMAGGIFIVPVLTIFGKVNIHTAVAVSLVSIIASSSSSASQFLKGGLTNIRVAIVLETATTLGAVTGVLLTGILPVQSLFLLFALVLFVSAWQMRVKPHGVIAATDIGARDWGRTLSLHSSYPDQPLGRDVFYHLGRVPLGLTLMYGAGFISALLGIGSGVLKIPAMDMALRLPIKVASATSNFMIGVTAAASGVAYLVRGDIDPLMAGPVALGSVLGALIGARLLTLISGEKLRLFFITVLILLGAQMLLSALGIDLVAAVKKHDF